MSIKKTALLFLLLCLLPLCALSETHTVENASLALSIDTQTLEVTVLHKETGRAMDGQVDVQKITSKEWKGLLGSTFCLDVSSGTSLSTKRVDMTASPYTIEVEKREDGLDATVDFPEQGQKLRLELRLEEDGLSICVPGDSIEEYGETSLCGLYLLPAFGATPLDSHTGYMLVPEAAGAIINFTDGEGVGNTPFSKRLYGGNIGVENAVVNASANAYINTNLSRPAEQITLPVYGMAYTDSGIGYLAVIEKGDASAEIKAYPGGVITDYNWAGAYFIIREEYIMPTTRSMGLRARESRGYLRDMQVRFYLLTDEEANYTGMAKKYRAVLEAEQRLRSSDTAYRPRLDFLGAESEKFLLWDQLVPMTSVSQASDILKDAKAEGLSAPLVIFRGWQSGGMSRNLGSGDLSVERALGAQAQMEMLQKQVEESGGRFLLQLDPVQANTERMYNMRLDIVRTIGQTIASIYTGGERYPYVYYLTPARTAEIMRDFAKRYAEKIGGVALDTLPNVLFSYYSAGNNFSRGETMDSYHAVLDEIKGMTVALQNPLAAYYADMDIYLDLPLGTTSYSFLSAEVPFLPLVLSGSVPYYSAYNNFDSNQQRQFLKLVEYGAYPSYLLTKEEVQKLAYTNSSDVFSASWEIMKETVLACDARLKDLWNKIGDRRMEDHSLLAPGVALVRWGEDLCICLNYTSKPYSFEGQQIAPLDYLVWEGGVQP